MSGATYFGLDLSGEARDSGFATLDADGTLLECGLLRTDADIFSAIANSGARTVAIDCPLGLPDGLCCLEEACPCAPSRTPGIRSSELAVRALGYGLYHTTKRTIIRNLVYRGIALRRALEQEGVRVLEVYPYATKAALFGRKMPKKHTPEGVEWLRTRIDACVPNAATLDRALTHDELDAILCAHTALLLDRGCAAALGEVSEGVIVVPRE